MPAWHSSAPPHCPARRPRPGLVQGPESPRVRRLVRRPLLGEQGLASRRMWNTSAENGEDAVEQSEGAQPRQKRPTGPSGASPPRHPVGSAPCPLPTRARGRPLTVPPLPRACPQTWALPWATWSPQPCGTRSTRCWWTRCVEGAGLGLATPGPRGGPPCVPPLDEHTHAATVALPHTAAAFMCARALCPRAANGGDWWWARGRGLCWHCRPDAPPACPSLPAPGAAQPQRGAPAAGLADGGHPGVEPGRGRRRRAGRSACSSSSSSAALACAAQLCGAASCWRC
jgi:hypothetical protein